MPVYVNPDRERFGAFRALERAGPIHMLNLVRLREMARYEDGRKATGREAYAAYGRESGPVLAKVGGRIVWSAGFELNLIGPEEEAWDIMFVAEYPSPDAFVAMVKDPAYKRAVVHRTAAVLDSRLIRTSPGTAGSTFG